MRYLVIEYLQQPDGKYNEKITIEPRLKDKHMTRAMVILDYKERKIVKLRADLAAGPRDFDRVSNFYKQNYRKVIETLEAGYALLDEVTSELEKVNTDGC
jgi:hypothetical protein